MRHLLKQIFTSKKFVVGLILFLILFFASFYPLFSQFHPMELVGSGFHKPGTYYNLADAVTTKTESLNVETSKNWNQKLSKKTVEKIRSWLLKYSNVEDQELNHANADQLVPIWLECYNPKAKQDGLLISDKRWYQKLDKEIKQMISVQNLVIATPNKDGVLEQQSAISSNIFVNGKDIGNQVKLPLGTDNFGADMLTKLTSAIGVSLRIGFIAGTIATLIGLTIGLVAGFVGGWIDNFLIFLTNIFTVIPSFVILILIANSIGQAARGPEVVALIIGVTAWPWTARSVRSQVISLRNRDHVYLSKLSGHGMPYIILRDILPYVASYVVMALILQVSSGILAEAQLSMLGLGPSTANVTTLGLMMQWATKFSAHTLGAWWAFVPVIISITGISFSMNLMNTGLDQVFNPQLRD